jgi:hypothetical protein
MRYLRSFGAVLLTLFAVGLGALGSLTVPAGADLFKPITLASQSEGNQQADYAHDAAISGNRRYVAFDGSYGGLRGVWRRDLQTGAVEAVAAEDPSSPADSAPDADLPSISEDGRYVSFTTTARLDPLDDTNRGPDVYVRDMDLPASQPCEPGAGSAQPCAYTLVSAVNESTTGLTYEYDPSRVESEELDNGSVAAGRSAISADGREVAFVTTAPSNLAGPGTPRLQVALRYLDSEHTELVSVADDPATGNPIPGQPVSGVEGTNVYGAAYGGGSVVPIFADPQPYAPPASVGASISADGSTVAWLGVDVPEQARMLPSEAVKDFYTEPLWRRVGDGPGAPIRRVTGGSDPTNSACVASGEAALPSHPSLDDPCQGPFEASQQGRLAGTWSPAEGDSVPRLSADGYTVAFLANAQLVALGEDFGSGSEPNSDLYLANMHEGLTRTQALRPLTELAGGDQADLAENGPIEDLGISPAGNDVAFTTKRTVFPLGSPAYVSAPEAAPGMLELFNVDLSDDTLTRVTQGFEGGPSEHPHTERITGQDPYGATGDGALSPSFSDDGNELAFASTASNLAFGDGNTPPLGVTGVDGSDAFVVERELFNPLYTPQSLSSPPAGPSIKASWKLGVTARSRADGSVALYVSVPGVGTVRAAAQSMLRVRTKLRGHAKTTVAARSVATTKRAARAGGGTLLSLVLTLAPRYKSLAAKRPGLAGTVKVSFTATGHSPLHQSVTVRFLRTKKAAKPKTKAKAKSVAKPRSAGGGRR